MLTLTLGKQKKRNTHQTKQTNQKNITGYVLLPFIYCRPPSFVNKRPLFFLSHNIIIFFLPVHIYDIPSMRERTRIKLLLPKSISNLVLVKKKGWDGKIDVCYGIFSSWLKSVNQRRTWRLSKTCHNTNHPQRKLTMTESAFVQRFFLFTSSLLWLIDWYKLTLECKFKWNSIWLFSNIVFTHT